MAVARAESAEAANAVSPPRQDAQSYADDNSLLFMETSAKTSMNVNEIFMAIGEWASAAGPAGGGA